MTGVSVTAALLGEMEKHARETYPEECCGFLIGKTPEAGGGGPRAVLAVEPAQNHARSPRRRRFLIPPEELREVDRRVARSGRMVIGFYHSHPDQRARPSRFDREHAWPGCTWILLAATATNLPVARAFELDPDSRVFREVPLSLETPPAVAPSIPGG